jgi:hypothetical protein
LQHAEDLAGNAADADDLAERLRIGKQLLRHRLADHTDLGGGLDMLVAKHFPFDQRPLTDLEILGRLAQDARVPVLIAGNDLGAGAVLRADGSHTLELRLNGQSVFQFQTLPVAPAQPRPAGTEGAGEDEQYVFPQPGNLLFHLLSGADTNDHAQHRQRGAHLVPAQRAQGDSEDGGDSHAGKLMG